MRDEAGQTSGNVQTRSIDCRACGQPLSVAPVGELNRCVECGIAELESEGHVAELWWSEDPSRNPLSVGWGGDDIWACSCGARDEDEGALPHGVRWAQRHATLTGGRVIESTAQ